MKEKIYKVEIINFNNKKEEKMVKKKHSKMLYKSGYFFSILGIIILAIGYFKKSIIVQSLQVNFIPMGGITLISGMTILLIWHLTKK